MTAIRGSVRHELRVAVPAEEVWTLVGDPTRLAEWFPGIVACEVEGDRRVITTRAGLPMPEHLLTIDATQRRFQYRITAPLFREHLATIDVHDLGDGTSLVVYSTDADPAALALVIGGASRAALANLPAALAGLPTEGTH